MFKTFFIFAVWLLLSVTAFSQTELVTAFGTQYGYAFHSYHSLVNDFSTYNLFIEVPFTKRTLLKVSAEYFQSKGYFGGYSFEYRGTGYFVSNGQLWQDGSLNAVCLFPITKEGGLGFGISADIIRVKRRMYSYYPFFIDSQDNVHIAPAEDKIQWFVRPGIIGTAYLGWKIGSHFNVFAEGRFKFVYAGKNYGELPLDSQSAINLYGGIKYFLK